MMNIVEGTYYSNRYKILERIGRGAISEVYKAFDELLKRIVVIKIFIEYSKKITNARIQKEALILAKINHPNIVRIYDVGKASNNFFLVLDYIDGFTLSDLIHTNPLSPYKAVEISIDILEALKYIHSLSIIHRDIKPSNILVTSDLSKAYLSDFGIGKYLKDEEELTSPGEVLGSLAYMSPEQLKGEDIKYSTDIYSMGIIIYEMIIGERPFKARDRVSLLSNILHMKAPTIKNSIPHINKSFSNLVEKMLSKNSKGRPSAEKLVVELKKIIEKIEKPDIDIELSKYKKIEKRKNDEDTERVYLYATRISDKQDAKATGFFESKEAKFNEFNKSINFYRNHLDSEYKSLLKQAQISFRLWVICFFIGFLILIFAAVMFSIERTIEGGLSLLSELFIYMVQNLFKLREDNYRSMASAKNRHLELGNYWNMAAQSIDSIENIEDRKEKLNKLIDHIIEQMDNIKLRM